MPQWISNPYVNKKVERPHVDQNVSLEREATERFWEVLGL